MKQLNRDEVQKKVVQLSNEYSYLILEHPTGFGKTLSAIKIIENNNEFWNICIAETNHELTWKDEFKKHNKEFLLTRVRFFCYQSLHHYIKEENFIFDEIHKLQSDIRLNLLEEIKQSNLKRFIGLSATLSRKQKENLNFIIPNIHYYKINLDKAIEDGVLPEPIVYLVELELNDTDKNVKFNFTKDKFKFVTEKEWYDLKTTWIEKLKFKFFSSQDGFDKIKWLRNGNERKKYLAEVKSKYAKILLMKLRDKRLICFANNIPQANYLSGNKMCIHSKIGKKDREQILTDFNEEKINKLFAVGMLREGVNLTNIEAGVIVQLDNVERTFFQVMGRVLRSKFPELYILYIKGTQDEQYIKTCLENFNMNYVKFVKLKEL